MDRETKTWASLAVGLRECDTLGRESTATSNSKLVASDVVLSTTSRASSVKRNSLSAEEVVTSGEVLGDGEVELSACISVRDVEYKSMNNIQL